MNIQKITGTINNIKTGISSKAAVLKSRANRCVSYKELGEPDKLEKIESIFAKNGDLAKETKTIIDFNKEPFASKIFIAGNMVIEDIAVKIVNFIDKFKK